MATLKTDKPDYAPGQTATFTLSDIDFGALYNFTIVERSDDPGDDGIANTYVLASITDGGEGDLDGFVNGQIVTSWIVPQSALNATLDLFASSEEQRGTAHNAEAMTTFTDTVIGGACYTDLRPYEYSRNSKRSTAKPATR